MKLEEGMYVRTKWGNGEQTISKCTNKVDIGDTQYSNNDFYIYTDKQGEVIYKSMILKASHNIIDLIEVGDYVNGYPVYETIDYPDNTRAIVIADDNKSIIWEESSQYIKSIVTKEQFESMKYEVK